MESYFELRNNQKLLENTDNVIKLKLSSDGPMYWQFVLKDIDSGKYLPLAPGFKLVVEENLTYIEAKIILYECDVNVLLHSELSDKIDTRDKEASNE